MSTSILTTKIFIPPPGPKAIFRPRLTKQLSDGLHHKLTLISASAGCGKTTLLSEWIVSCHRPVAWLSLDEEHNEPTRFLMYFISSLQAINADVGVGVLNTLQSPQPPSIDSILTMLLNDISTMMKSFVFVLDDYHIIDAKPVDHILNFLIKHLPVHMHLVMATREDPPIPLARLRAKGQLTELRAPDLCFTSSEAAEFLNQVMSLNLSPEDINALEVRTEGWVAGLQLAAISLQGRKDIDSFINDFTGSHRFVLDYLLEEVLHQQSKNVTTFLLRTSILDRFCTSLCEALLSDFVINEQETLTYLESINLFLIPLDDKRQWYRYHHLFADVLRARSKEVLSHQLVELHRRASLWFAENGLSSDAIKHAFAAKDFELAAGLIEGEWPAIHRGFLQSHTFLGWVKSLPDEFIRVRPVLSTGYAWELLNIGELEAAEEKLKDAENWLNKPQKNSNEMVVEDEEEFQSLPATIAIARAYLAQALGNITDTIKHASQALSLLAVSDHISRGPASALLGLAYWSKGELEPAYKYLAEGMASLQKAGNMVFAISGTFGLADIRIMQGRLLEAISLYKETLKRVKDYGEPVLQGTAELYLGLSELYREQDDLSASIQHLEKSEQLGEQAGLPNWPYRFRLGQARLKQTLGEFDRALELLDEAEQFYYRGPLPDLQTVAGLKARLWIRQGNLNKVISWIESENLTLKDRPAVLKEFNQITLVRTYIAQYKAQFKNDQHDHTMQDVQQFIQQLLIAAKEGERAGSLIELFILQALCLQAQDEPSHAIESLQQALMLAEPESYIRIFVDEGSDMFDLLSLAESKGITPIYVRKLLCAFDSDVQENRQTIVSSVANIPNDPLSKRELKVLQLIAQGLSNREIGERLFLALDTIKGHNRRIFSKLQAKNRTEAIARAKSLDIL